SDREKMAFNLIHCGMRVPHSPQMNKLTQNYVLPGCIAESLVTLKTAKIWTRFGWLTEEHECNGTNDADPDGIDVRGPHLRFGLNPKLAGSFRDRLVGNIARACE